MLCCAGAEARDLLRCRRRPYNSGMAVLLRLASRAPQPRSRRAGIWQHALAQLLDGYDHRVGTDEVFHARLAETGRCEPTAAVGPGVVEPAFGLDQHVQADQEPEGVLPTLVVDY